MARSVAQLEAEAVRLLRAISTLGEKDRSRRGNLIHDLAEAFVELREHFVTADGRPDWAGRTWAYKDLINRMYREANISQDKRKSLGVTVRYHVGNLLRERLSADEIDAAGLVSTSPREREREKDVARTEAVRLIHGSVDEDPDLVKAIASAALLLSKVTEDRLGGLSGNERKLARQALDKVLSTAGHLRETMKR